MNDSKDFQDAESVRSGNSHVTSRPVSFPPHPIPEGMLSRSFGVASRREGPPSIWDTHGISGNGFADPVASSSAPNPQGINPYPWSSNISEQIHSSQAVKSKNQSPIQDQRCQSGPSVHNSVIRSKELWCRPTATADFRSSFRQMHHASNVHLMEDKIQD